MTGSRSKDNPNDGKPRPAGADKLLTSEDLFGDIVDAPMEPSSDASERTAPIRVQISEPGAGKAVRAPARPSAASGPSEVREAPPEEFAALLDVFDAAPAPQAPSPPPAKPAPPPVKAAPPPAAVKPIPPAVKPAPPPSPPKPAPPTAKAPAPAPPKPAPPRPAAPAPAPPAPKAAPVPAKPVAPAAPPPRPPAAPLPRAAPLAPPPETEKTPPPDLSELDDDLLHPASRTSTKFAAVPPRNRPPNAPSVDLASIAEDALGQKTSPGTVLPTPAERARAGIVVYGPYRLLDRIAVGGMAEVFKAKRSGVEGFEKVVAVKRILPHLSDNKEFVNMFINEAKMVAGLTHPNIVQIFDLGKIEKTYFIAMEYVHGRDLRTIVKRAKERGIRVPLDLAVLIVGKVCAALEYAHRKKDDRGRAMQIVHRDVSPQNILISYEGDVKLTDFGIAKAAAQATHTDRGALRGKLLYMSPEQANGRSMDCRSDVFSMGIVFYEMITDTRPFMSTSEKSILELVRECQVPAPMTLNPRIPPRLDKIVMKALAREPVDRYQDASEMARDLERFLHERNAPNPTAVELARFMEVLFDEKERGAQVVDESSGSGEIRVPPPVNGLEMEFESDSDPGQPTAPVEPMSVQKLLKRFGLK